MINFSKLKNSPKHTDYIHELQTYTVKLMTVRLFSLEKHSGATPISRGHYIR